MNKLILSVFVSLFAISNMAHAQTQELSTGSSNDAPAADTVDYVPMEMPEGSSEADTSAASTPAPPPESIKASPAKKSKSKVTAQTTALPTPKPPKKITSISHWTASLSSLQWNEQLTVLKADKSAYFPANYNCLALGLATETTYLHWGWNFGILYGVGRASGGGDDSATSISYNQSKKAFTILGITPRVFWRLTNRVNFGTSAFVYSRSISWPEEDNSSVESGRRVNTTVIADMNIKLLNQWDFYQGIAPLEAGATLWKLGIIYRFR